MKFYKGIDISFYQGEPDFKKIKESGIDFVFHKVGQGRTADYDSPFVDPAFEKNIKECARTAQENQGGFYSGAYWYFMGNTREQTEKEAQFFINLLQKYKYNIQLWAAIDVEDAYLVDDYVSLSKNVKLFCDMVKQAGFRPMVYASSSWLNNRFEVPDGVPIWEANWSISKIPQRARMLQWTSNGKVGGIEGNVDMNLAYDIIGDTNDDGKVNIKDVSAILKHVAGWKNKINESQADIDQDGYVTTKDASSLIKKIFYN